MSKKHLNTNKQFMIGNGLLAFGVIIIVVLFTYLSFKGSKKNEEKLNIQKFTLNFNKGFLGDSLSVFLNDSLLIQKRISQEPFICSFNRFEKKKTLY